MFRVGHKNLLHTYLLGNCRIPGAV